MIDEQKRAHSCSTPYSEVGYNRVHVVTTLNQIGTAEEMILLSLLTLVNADNLASIVKNHGK